MKYNENGVLMSVGENDKIEVWGIKKGFVKGPWKDILKNKAEYFLEGLCVVRYDNIAKSKEKSCFLTIHGVNPFGKDFMWCYSFERGLALVRDYGESGWHYINYLGNKVNWEEKDKYWRKYGDDSCLKLDEFEQNLEEKLKLAQRREGV